MEFVKNRLKGTFFHKYYKLLTDDKFSEEFEYKVLKSPVGEIKIEIPSHAKDWYQEEHEPVLSSELYRLLDKTKTFYDVGSQFGYYIELALGCGVIGNNIHSFEVSYYRYYSFIAKYASCGVKVNNRLVTHESNKLAKKVYDEITLDEYAEGNEYPDVVKIDVEGGEGNVVKGMKNEVLKRKPFVYLELHPSKLPNFENGMYEIISVLKDYSYDLEATDHRDNNSDWRDAERMGEHDSTYLIKATP